MKVILIKDVEKIGKLGETIDVSDGYARNFLMPKKLAMASNPLNARRAENIKLKTERALQAEINAAKEFAEKLSKVSCTVAVQVGPDEKLYGSVTPADMQKALEVEGFNIDKKQISMDAQVEKLGVYHFNVKVHPEVHATVKLWVVKR
ncbi:MAG: 50S ribosomal protein L9 [Candidatus Omnitrophica bacterium CG12_big_fil_rev_8_21_14_0_65_43_15]|uniref:Large ribosomal subunit protein bL9 n=1 Tax=Candidatus Taenaricola geysiri TaxID=1974752 RepID=A0A2J0LJ61_9BACT|nr:MAG: 50S ribosomal protein L9 [Candidatus Omnitrophica bacterium CG1_02_43_210]PIR66032.1 MAG: 50S ribosomal protein L9 [Candidatus Omnitrophica bacterium CG10_big_fil_rev_8_21_14_0_10_43_8]PIV11719.1 MAG: 50S ribosomal protein L9 [Candidatus Omnitrophica bacterium CG03_land_8_20_14_0_80_43_22]PIW66894.1 MAG: 50S ribosomal protein L9 [Candidatus Omnitrophica bacterium CG12_big_fil_rev_8_21_14_0_65_43_15]PIW80633.1 MAG: 50S ribosomal protein L9 [Candidatus Omnitrophica bacterium CG_4_8_14_3_u